MSTQCSGVGRDEQVPIHWIGFGAGQVIAGVLDSRAKYMFTYAMGGCTSGAGSQTGDSVCLVAHANAKGLAENTGGPATHRALQRRQLPDELGDGVRVRSSLQCQKLGGLVAHEGHQVCGPGAN